MTAAYVNEWCAVGTVPDTISFGPVPAPPAPKKAEVLIGVKAASINVDDVPLLQDTAAGGWCFHTRKPSATEPLVGGMDYAGVVLACGPGCKRLKVGDRVCGIVKVAEYQAGTWAEQTLAPESDVCLIEDDGLSFVDAAAVAMGAFVGSDMLKKAAKALSADVATVSRAVRALCYVLVDAATAGRPAEEVLQGVDELLELPAGSRESLAQFYSDVAAELEQETRKSLDLPRYRGLEWRLQVTLAGRYAPRQTPQPSFLLRLHTSAGGEANASRPEQHLLQADLATLRRITSELSEALAEDKSKHSRRIARRL